MKRLALKLKESQAIPKDIYNTVFDRNTGMATTDRYTTVINYVQRAINTNGTLFNTLLQAFRYCGEAPLADELQQCYSKLHYCCCTRMYWLV